MISWLRKAGSDSSFNYSKAVSHFQGIAAIGGLFTNHDIRRWFRLLEVCLDELNSYSQNLYCCLLYLLYQSRSVSWTSLSESVSQDTKSVCKSVDVEHFVLIYFILTAGASIFRGAISNDFPNRIWIANNKQHAMRILAYSRGSAAQQGLLGRCQQQQAGGYDSAAMALIGWLALRKRLGLSCGQ